MLSEERAGWGTSASQERLGRGGTWGRWRKSCTSHPSSTPLTPRLLCLRLVPRAPWSHLLSHLYHSINPTLRIDGAAGMGRRRTCGEGSEMNGKDRIMDHGSHLCFSSLPHPLSQNASPFPFIYLFSVVRRGWTASWLCFVYSQEWICANHPSVCSPLLVMPAGVGCLWGEEAMGSHASRLGACRCYPYLFAYFCLLPSSPLRPASGLAVASGLRSGPGGRLRVRACTLLM
ncbi:hypothetical protein B0H14DRAFT_451259 [Mycena olivaceomarginata]|nr:hypothetical protein B0H14DRAFT_451259 [Mycena olivaceomarginata]